MDKFRRRLLPILILLSLSAYSQEYLDLAKISYFTSENSRFDNGEPGRPIHEWNVQLDLPLVLNPKNAFIVGFMGSGLGISLSPEQTRNSNIYSFNFRLGLNTQYNDVWSGTYLVIPRITTDFSNGLRRGYQLGFAAVINQKISTRLKYSYGLYTNTEEFGQLIVPLLGGYYITEDNKWEVTALFPAVLDVNRNLSNRSSIGFRYEGLGTTYSIDNEYFEDAYLTRGASQLFLYYQYKITPSLIMRVKSGYEFRGYRVFDDDDKVSLSLASIYINDNRKILNSELNDYLIFNVELFYRFNFPKEKTPTLNDKL